MDDLSSARGLAGVQAPPALCFLKMAHPLTVKINSAIYSLDTPIFPRWYWFMGVQIMSRMFCYAVRGGNERIKKKKTHTHTHTHTHTRPEEFVFSALNGFLLVALTARLKHIDANVFVCVTTCGCRAPVKRHHMSRESRMASASLPVRLQLLTEDQKRKIPWNLDADERRLCETSESQFMYSSVSKLQDYINIILAHVIRNVHASCVHIFKKKKLKHLFWRTRTETVAEKERKRFGWALCREMPVDMEWANVCLYNGR